MEPKDSGADEPGAPLGRPPADLPQSPGLSYRPRTEPGSNAETIARPEGADARREPSPTPSPGEDLAGYKLVRVVGRGAMGEVWEAVQPGLWRRVAVKRLRRFNPLSGRDDGSSLKAFQGEAMVAALLDHPNIVPVYGFEVGADGAPVLSMKLVGGAPWSDLLRRDFAELEPPAHLARHLPILLQVCQAVAFAHSRGIAHLDLKPSQVMVGEYGEVLLMDWGLAAMVAEPEATPSPLPDEELRKLLRANLRAPAGTPSYMAPEQTYINADEIGPWTDAYLLGGMLYYLLAGQPPHPGETADQAYMAAVDGIVAPLDEVAPDRPMPEGLRDLAMAALSPQPGDRPTAEQFRRRLEEFLTGEGNRRESQRIVALVPPVEELRTYSDFSDASSRASRAQELWPGNPACRPLLEAIAQGHADLALRRGDLSLARVQCERVRDPEARSRLSGRIAAAERAAARQRRRVRALAGALAGVLAAAAIGGFVFTARLADANRVTREQLSIATEAREAEAGARRDAERSSARAQILLAESLIRQGRHADARRELLRVSEPQRAWEWRLALTRALDSLWDSPFEYLEWSPTREYAIASEASRGLWILRAFTGEPLVQISTAHYDPSVRVPRLPPPPMAFTRDERLAAVAVPGTSLLAVFDMERRERIAEFDLPEDSTASTIEFSPDATRLAIGAHEGTVWIQPLEGGAPSLLAAHRQRVRHAFWGASKLVTVSIDQVRRLDPDTGQGVVLHQGQAGEWVWHSFAAVADRQRRVFAFFHVGLPAMAGQIDEGPIWSLAYPPNGAQFLGDTTVLAATGWSAEPPVLVADLATREILPPVLPSVLNPIQGGPTGYPRGYWASIDPDEAGSVALAWLDGRHTLLSFPSFFHHPQAFEMPGDGVRLARLAPGGEAVWAVGEFGGTRLKATDSEATAAPFSGNPYAFLDDGRVIGAFGHSSLRFFDASTGALLFSGAQHIFAYLGIDRPTDWPTLSVAGFRGDHLVLETSDASTSRVLASHALDQDLAAVALSARAGLAAVVRESDPSSTRLLRIDGEELEEIQEIDLGGGLVHYSVAFDPPGERLLIAASDGRIHAIDAATGRVASAVRAHEGAALGIVRMDAHGVWATYGEDRVVALWDAQGMGERGRARFTFVPAGAVLSSDGRFVLAWPAIGPAEIRSAEDGSLRARLDRTDFPMRRAHFVDNDRRVVSAQGGRLRAWDAATGEEAFHLDAGFGIADPGGDRVVLRRRDFQSMIVDLAPAVAEPGTSYAETLDRWRIERLADWAGRRVHRAIPADLATLMARDEPIGHPVQWAHQDIEWYRAAYAPQSQPPEVRLRILALASQLLAAAPPDELAYGWHIVDHAIKDPAVLAAHANGPIGDGFLRHFARASAIGVDGETRVQSGSEPIGVLAASAAILLHHRGDHERARQAARHAWAANAVGSRPDHLYDWILDLVGAEAPEPPAPAISFAPFDGIPPGLLAATPHEPPTRFHKQGDPMDLRRAASRAAHDYVLRVAPPPDWHALVAEIDAAGRLEPYPEGLGVSEVAERLADEIATLLHGSPEAMEEAARAARQRTLDDFAWALRRSGNPSPAGTQNPGESP